MTPLWANSGPAFAPKAQGHTVKENNDSTVRIQRAESKQPKRGLLAAAASQNYQRCYKALKALETYWAGTRYIVTVLDQKAKGSLDPLLYTAEYLGPSDSSDASALPAARGKPPNLAQGDPQFPLSVADHQAHMTELKSAMGARQESLSIRNGVEASQGKTSSQTSALFAKDGH